MNQKVVAAHQPTMNKKNKEDKITSSQIQLIQQKVQISLVVSTAQYSSMRIMGIYCVFLLNPYQELYNKR